jgi:hypothetical protein
MHEQQKRPDQWRLGFGQRRRALHPSRNRRLDLLVVSERQTRTSSMAKSTTRKLPKKIAGVTVPKFLRQPGTIAEFLNSPVGRAVLAEALVAAAAALKNYKPAAETVGQAVDTVEKAGSETAATAKHLAQGAAGGLADMTAGAGRQIVPAFSAADDHTDPELEKRGKPKRDKDSDSPSTH